MGFGAGLQRLRDGVRRHGVIGVCRILLNAFRRRGPVAMLEALKGQGPFLAAAGDLTPARRRAVWPPLLDQDGRLPADSWERWLRRAWPSAPPAALAEAPPLVVVLNPGPAGEAGLEETRQAVAAADLPVISLAEAPRAPQALHLFLQAGDVPDPGLFEALRRAGADPAVQALTFDLLRRSGDQVQPLLAPGANPALLEACDYIFSRAALKGAAFDHAPASARTALLAWCAGRSPTDIRAGWRHLPAPPLLRAEVGDAELAMRHAVRFDAPGAARLGVSAVICTHDKGHLLRQLVRQLLLLGQDQLAELVIVSNNTTNPYAVRTLEALAREDRVRVIRDDEPFNFSRQVNAGVRATRGRGPLLLLNDDLVPASEDWLSALAARLEDPRVGAVGPLLLYPDERVQHAGMYLRLPGGAGHILRGALLPTDDPLGFTAGPREVSCLTGAVLLTRREAFERAGGLDEELAISFQDVDYCLKLHQGGLRNLFEPRSVLIHMESVSLDKAGTDPRLLEQRSRERALMNQRWGARFPRDPFMPAALDLGDEGLRRLAGTHGSPRP